MIRRLLLALAGLLIFAAALLAATIAYREHVLQAVIEEELAKQGVPRARLTVDAVEADRARITGLAAGRAAELRIDSLDVRYDPGQLLDGPAAIEHVTIRGLVLRVDLTGNGPPLGSLQPLLDRQTGSGTTVGPVPPSPQASPSEIARSRTPLPPTTLRNARIELATPFGLVTASLDGNLRQDDDGTLAANLALALRSDLGSLSGALSAAHAPNAETDGTLIVNQAKLALPEAAEGLPAEIGGLAGHVDFALSQGRPTSIRGDLAFRRIGLAETRFSAARLTFDLNETEGKAAGGITAEDGLFEAALDLGVRDYLGQPEIDLEMTAGTSAGAALLDLLPLPPPAAGEATVSLKTWGRLAPFADFGSEDAANLAIAPKAARPLLAWLGKARLGARIETALSELAYPERFSGLSAGFTADASLEDGGLSLALTHDGGLVVEDLATGLLSAAGLPDEAIDMLSDGARLDLSGPGDNPTRLLLRPTSRGAEISLSGQADFTLGDAAEPQLEAEGLAQIDLTSLRTVERLAVKDLSLSARDLRYAGIPISSVKVSAEASGSPANLEGTAELDARIERFNLDDLSVRNIEIVLPLAFATTGEALEAGLLETGRLAASRLTRGEVVVTSPAAKVTRGLIVLSRPSADETGGGRLVHDILLDPVPLRLALPRGGEAPLKATADLGPLRLAGEWDHGADYEGRASLEGGYVAVTEYGLDAEGLSASADFNADLSQASGRFRVASLSAGDRLAPLSLEGRMRRRGSNVTLDVEARLLGLAPGTDAPSLPISGRYDLRSGTGRFEVQPTSIAFSPGGLQPADLMPGLPALGNVAGRAEVSGQVVLTPQQVSHTAALKLEDMNLQSGDIAVKGLDLALQLDGLQPPSSPPGQRLNIERVESLADLADLDASFQILPSQNGATPRARLERLTFRLAGGDVLIRDAMIAPDSPRHSATIDVSGLDLEAFLVLLDVEGLKGSGRLSGRIPVVLEGDQVAIEGGRLESAGPGLLSYLSSKLTSSLPPDADDLTILQSPVDLAILALTNFNYDRLTIGLDKEITGEAKLSLQLEGKNPDLLDGYPFKFNINLTGNVNPLIAALRQGLTLSDELIRRTWKIGP